MPETPWCSGIARRSLGVALASVFGARVGAAQTNEDIALDFVRTFRLGDNLTQMATSVIGGNIAYRVIVRKVGEEQAGVLVGEHLRQSAARHQDQWDRNLAASFLDYLTAPELASLVQERRNSPYAAKWIAHRDDIGGRMQARSRDLLATVVAEALTTANAAAPEPPPR